MNRGLVASVGERDTVYRRPNDRLTISDSRFYTDEEVAMILREAVQSADSPAGLPGSSAGLSLEQIKAAAAEAGLDPSLVERAALRLEHRKPASLLERVAGGPIRHRATVHIAAPMSEKMSTRMLSAIRAAVEVPGTGSADAGGFSWHAWYRASRLSVTAHEDSKGTHVQILVDRSAAMVQTILAVVVVSYIWMALAVEGINSYPEVLAFFAIPIGLLAAARAYWKSSTRSLRERITVLLDAVRETPPTG